MSRGDDAEALTVARVASVLGVHINTVRKLIRRGALPAFRVGRRLRVARVDLIEYRRRQRVVVVAEVPKIGQKEGG